MKLEISRIDALFVGSKHGAASKKPRLELTVAFTQLLGKRIQMSIEDTVIYTGYDNFSDLLNGLATDFFMQNLINKGEFYELDSMNIQFTKDNIK